MASKVPPREELDRTIEAFTRLGSQKKAAAELGIARSTLQNRLRLAQVSEHTDAVGLRLRPHPVPRIISDPVPVLARAFRDFRGQAQLSRAPHEEWAPDLLTVYVIADLHLGMYAWKAETGADYDVDIATRIFDEVTQDLIERSPASEQAIILNLGDFYHSDNNEARTLRSAAALDVDTRYARVLQAGTEILLNMIQLAVQKHGRVLVRNIPGNHDPYGALALTMALSSYYSGRSHRGRVTVDRDPGPFFWHQHGRTLIGAMHGDMLSPLQAAGVMAAKVPEMWGSSDFRYIYMGHTHRKSRGANMDLGGEIGGATWETFQTIAPRDAWGNSIGRTMGRSMQAIVLHRKRGEWNRLTSPVLGT